MKLSRTVAYAVRATLQLAEKQSATPVPCSELASRGNMPERFLLQILRNLVTHGILRSTRGVEGGYSLVRPPQDISLLDVIEAIEGPYDSGGDLVEFVEDPAHDKLHEALKQLSENSRRELQAIKLSQLLRVPTEAEESSESATSADTVDDAPSVT